MYKHLSKEDRIKIEYYLNKKYSLTKIANIIGIDKSTVSREVRRITPYDAEKADEIAKLKIKTNKPELRIKVNALYLSGFTKRKITRMTGLSWYSINKMLEREDDGV